MKHTMHGYTACIVLQPIEYRCRVFTHRNTYSGQQRSNACTHAQHHMQLLQTTEQVLHIYVCICTYSIQHSQTVVPTMYVML